MFVTMGDPVSEQARCMAVRTLTRPLYDFVQLNPERLAVLRRLVMEVDDVIANLIQVVVFDRQLVKFAVQRSEL
jgi:hypothetical protein